MKILKSDLLPVLEFLYAIVPTKTTMPILTCFRISIGAGRFQVQANSITQFGEMFFACDTGKSKPVNCCVPANRLLLAVRGAGDELDIDFGANSITVSGMGTCTIKTLSADEFPAYDDTNLTGVGLNCCDVGFQIKAVAWVPPVGEARASLNCINVKTTAKNIRATATDGRIMASSSADSIAAEAEFNIPFERAASFCESLNRKGASLLLGENKIAVDFEGGLHSITLPNNGPYPNISMYLSGGESIGKILPSEILPKLQMCEGQMRGELFVKLNASFDKTGLQFQSIGKDGEYDSGIIPGKFKDVDLIWSCEHIASAFKRFDESPVELSSSESAFFMAQGGLMVATVLVKAPKSDAK